MAGPVGEVTAAQGRPRPGPGRPPRPAACGARIRPACAGRSGSAPRRRRPPRRCPAAAARQTGGAQLLHLGSHGEGARPRRPAAEHPGPRLRVNACQPIAAASKAIDTDMSNPFARGRNSACNSPCDTRTGRSTSMASTGKSCSTMPAQSIRNTKSFAEPSRIGISGPSISSTALCTPQPASAARACSTVPPAPRAVGQAEHGAQAGVDHVVEPGGDVHAGMAGGVGQVGAPHHKSAAGRRRAQRQRHALAAMQPTPTQDMAERRVRWAPNPCPAITGLIWSLRQAMRRPALRRPGSHLTAPDRSSQGGTCVVAHPSRGLPLGPCRPRCRFGPAPVRCASIKRKGPAGGRASQ